MLKARNTQRFSNIKKTFDYFRHNIFSNKPLASCNKTLSPVEAILDKNNTENIFLYDAEGKKIEFEQIAVLVVREKLCVLLKPVTKLTYMAENEALVFLIDKKGDEENLYIAEDNELIDEAFEQYYKKLTETD